MRDYYEMLENSQSIPGGLSESKKAIGVVQQMVPQLTLTPLNPLLDEMRWIKSPYEIELIKNFRRSHRLCKPVAPAS